MEDWAEIRRLRRAEGESISEIARRLGISRNTVRSALASDRVGAENAVTSCDLHVLVHETAESVSSQQPNRRTGGWGSAACGRVLMQRSVRTVAVVVLNVLAQHYIEVGAAR